MDFDLDSDYEKFRKRRGDDRDEIARALPEGFPRLLRLDFPMEDGAEIY